MAASRLSRIAGRRLTLLSCLMTIALAGVSTDTLPTEHVDDVELISVPRGGSDEFVAITGPEGDDKLGTSSSDLKKNSLNKKFQKFYPKTEADWNFKGEGKKTDVFIKDAKDHRLLRIISEGLLRPQDVLPVVPNDAIITSSQKNVAAGSNEEMSVNVQPEGMSGIVNDGIAVDSDEKIIIEKKINASVERFQPKIEFDVSTESDGSVNINLDANAGVQSPTFHKQKGSITVPVQKQITLSKGKENHLYKKSHETSTIINGAAHHNGGASNNFDVISLTKQQKNKNAPIDEGVFDFVDSPLSDKHLVSAGTAQTSRINVKKGPNGQDYEYEYIYYYYEDPDEATTGQAKAEKGHKGNEIPSSTGGPNLRTTTPSIRTSPTPSSLFTRPFTEETIATKVKTTDPLNEANVVPQSTTSRDKFRNDFRYTIDNSVVFPPQTSIDSNKNVASNEVFWNYDTSRLPGRQAQPQSIPQPPISQQSHHEHTIPQHHASQQSLHDHSHPQHHHVSQQSLHDHSHPPHHHISQQSFVPQSTVGQTAAAEITTTVKPSRGRVHYNAAKTTTTETTEVDDDEFVVNTVPVSTTQPPRETSRGKSTAGTVRQPGLELVDSNSFRTHSTNVPNNFETGYSPAQTFDVSRGKLHKQTPQQEFSTLAQNSLPIGGPVSSTNSWNIQDIFRKEQTNEYVAGTERSSPSSTSPRTTPSLVTETIVDNTAPISTLSDNSLTTVYGPGLTDKAAHDLYAIYQQTQNEETVRNTIAQDDRTTVVDEQPTRSFVSQTHHPTTRVFTTLISTTTPSPTTISTATTTTTPPPTTAAFVSPSSAVPIHTRGRFRGANTRARLSATSTEAITPADGAPESTSERLRKFQPSVRREPNRISAYGRRGSTTTSAPGGEEASSTVAHESSRSSFHPGSSRNRFRSSTVRQEVTSSESQSTSVRPNFADRYSSRRRPSFRASTTTVASVDDANAPKHDAPESEAVAEQQSTTHRSIRNRFNTNANRPKPLRPEAKLNFASRGRFSATSPPTSVSVPLDADTSGSADVPVEQKQIEENGEHQTDGINETTLGSTFSTTPSTTTSGDTFSRLKHRPKLRISDKGSHAKAQAQQLNNTLSLNQNRRNLAHNLLPRKKQLHAPTDSAHEVKEEKSEIAPRPVTEEVEDDAPQAKQQGDVEIAESQPAVEEVLSSTTTEHTNNKLSSLLASRRHNLANRKPGTFQRTNKQTAATTEES